jgi:hypothetical protein
VGRDEYRLRCVVFEDDEALLENTVDGLPYHMLGGLP